MADKRKGVRVDAYINEHENKMLESFIVRNHYTMSEIVREALNEFLQAHDKEFYDLYVNNHGLKPGYYITLTAR